MLTDKLLLDRWQSSPWREAKTIIADRNCTKDQFLQMLKMLYPNGGEIATSDTHRGRAELYDFRYIDLSGRDLQEVDFYKLDMRGANFSQAKISNSCFETSQLEYAVFSDITESNHTNFTGCFARYAKFCNAKLKNGQLSGSDFSSADFSEAIFESCDFSQSILLNVNFRGARMIDCNGRGLRLSEQERDAEWFRQSTFRSADRINWVS
jgi:uncharacterized protein YjbI with pentapeptide repeats